MSGEFTEVSPWPRVAVVAAAEAVTVPLLRRAAIIDVPVTGLLTPSRRRGAAVSRSSPGCWSRRGLSEGLTPRSSALSGPLRVPGSPRTCGVPPRPAAVVAGGGALVAIVFVSGLAESTVRLVLLARLGHGLDQRFGNASTS